MRRYSIVLDATAPPWAARLQADLNRVLDQIGADTVTKTILKLALPTDGSVVTAVVPDAVGGAVLAFFDGTDWRRATDQAVVT